MKILRSDCRWIFVSHALSEDGNFEIFLHKNIEKHATKISQDMLFTLKMNTHHLLCKKRSHLCKKEHIMSLETKEEKKKQQIERVTVNHYALGIINFVVSAYDFINSHSISFYNASNNFVRNNHSDCSFKYSSTHSGTSKKKIFEKRTSYTTSAVL